MDTSTLESILQEEMQKYAGKGLNARSVLAVNEHEHFYSVIDIATTHGQRIVGTVLIARVVGDQIVIELDHNSDLLVDALLARDIPRAQIILAYEGDPVPV